MKLWLACGPALALGGREGLSTRGRGGLQSIPRSSNQSSTEPPPSHSWLYNVNEQSIELKLKERKKDLGELLCQRVLFGRQALLPPRLDWEVSTKSWSVWGPLGARTSGEVGGVTFSFSLFFVSFSFFFVPFPFPLFLCSQPMSLSLQEGNNFLGWSTKKGNVGVVMINLQLHCEQKRDYVGKWEKIPHTWVFVHLLFV